jgi:predicted O-methyltransferase YrrM
MAFSPQTSATLETLHQKAKGDRWKIARGIPAVALGFVRGIPAQQSIAPYLSEAFIPVSPDSGRLLLQTAIAARARNIVEFGTSYGISTIYLATAARETGGRVIGTEIEPRKHAKAREHLRQAGVDDLVDVRLGDARETLKDVETVDFLLLDGWKDLYLPVLDLLLPKLTSRAVVVADNIFTFRKAMRPYVRRMQAPGSGFYSVTVPIGEGMEFSIRDGGGPADAQVGD